MACKKTLRRGIKKYERCAKSTVRMGNNRPSSITARHLGEIQGRIYHGGDRMESKWAHILESSQDCAQYTSTGERGGANCGGAWVFGEEWGCKADNR